MKYVLAILTIVFFLSGSTKKECGTVYANSRTFFILDKLVFSHFYPGARLLMPNKSGSPDKELLTKGSQFMLRHSQKSCADLPLSTGNCMQIV